MRTHEEIIASLEEKIPRDAISRRDAGNGRKLDYLETWYAIDRMNTVFGNLFWDSETVEMREIPGQDKPTYVARVRVTAMVKVGDTQYLKIVREGTGYGRDKNALNPHEMASKEAESDALKRAIMKFGKSMGLALYSKDGDFIDEGSTSKAQPSPAPTAAVPAPPAAFNRELCNKSISQHAKILLDKKACSQADLSEMISKYGVPKKEDLSDSQAQELLAALKKRLNG